MFGLSLGFVIETLVAILLATTIAYCIILNQRLKRLHSDRDQLRKMVMDLVSATNLANAAIKELKSTAVEAEQVLQSRLDEAERFGMQLAQHVSAGQQVMDRIARITTAAARPATEPATLSAAIETPQPISMAERRPPIVVAPEPTKLQAALLQLTQRQRMRGDAA